MKVFRFAAIVAAALMLLACYAAAQGQFSQQGAQAIINAKDWNRLLAYGKAWAQAQPNNPTAYYVIARAYGSKCYNIDLGCCHGLPFGRPWHHRLPARRQ